MDETKTTDPGRSGERQRRILQELYAGPRGELTFLLQYLYQSCVLSRCDPQLAQALDSMAKVEARHLEILGTLIVQQGGAPVYGTPAGWWSGQSVAADKDPCRMLLRNLRGKVEAVDAYLRAAGEIGDRELARILRRIAGEEMAHVELLRALIDRRGCRR